MSILFDGPGEIDLLALRKELPKRFFSIDSVQSEGKLLLQIGIGESLRMRHFQKGKRIVLDALENAAGVTASTPTRTPPNVIAVPGSATLQPERPKESGSENVKAHLPAGIAALNLAGLRAAALTARSKNQSSTQFEDERHPDATERALSATLPPAPPLTVSAEAISGGMRLRLLWDRRVGASVFRRMGYLWMVFDVPRIVDLSALGMADRMTGTITSADQLRAPGATVLRFGIAADLWPRVARSGNTWLVEMTDAPLPPAKPLLIRAEPSAKGGARVLVPTPGAGRAIKINDPEVGDTLIVVPVREPGVGVKTGRAFVQFDIIASAQGIMAFKTRADDVAIDIKVTGVEVTSPHELYMSADAVTSTGRLAEISDGLETAMGPLFEYEACRRDDLGQYIDARRLLQHAVVSAGIEVRTERRLSLANFHFAHGLAEDAIGVIHRIAEEDPKSLERPDFLALRGATLMLLGRAEEAAADLNREILDGDMDVTLWRAALTATRGDWQGADSAFAISGPAFERLPLDLRARFGLLAAHAALAVGNYHRVNRLVERIEAEAPNKNDKMEARYLRATAYQRTGKTEAALEYFDKLAIDGSPPVRARAELSRVELMLHLGRMTRSDAIVALERLRHAWRGDSFEQLLLRRLAELYREEKNYLNALQAMRDAVENFPQSAAAPAVNEQMQRMFSDLFIDGGADTLSPLTALSLYYEFGDLSEDGAAGGRIAEGLANRLVDVDLLDRAGELLNRQLDAVAGVDKSRIGAHLAIIQLLDQEPAHALDTLKLSQGEGIDMPVALKQQRRHLEARALAAVGDGDAALVLLKADQTRDAALLRADIYWRSEQWAEASTELGKAFDHAGGDIAVHEQHLIMRQVVALMLSDNTSELARLRLQYGAGMAESVYKNAFDLITRSSDTDAVPVHELPKILANIEGAEAFLRTYRDSPPTEGVNSDIDTNAVN
ncbi:MAG: tetratricopeptide repeat protein [Proteobacteria bacterium]|nr:tetratricopeptide repeat protein [Pseudomonadota bacterium]